MGDNHPFVVKVPVIRKRRIRFTKEVDIDILGLVIQENPFLDHPQWDVIAETVRTRWLIEVTGRNVKERVRHIWEDFKKKEPRRIVASGQEECVDELVQRLTTVSQMKEHADANPQLIKKKGKRPYDAAKAAKNEGKAMRDSAAERFVRNLQVNKDDLENIDINNLEFEVVDINDPVGAVDEQPTSCSTRPVPNPLAKSFALLDSSSEDGQSNAPITQARDNNDTEVITVDDIFLQDDTIATIDNQPVPNDETAITRKTAVREERRPDQQTSRPNVDCTEIGTPFRPLRTVVSKNRSKEVVDKSNTGSAAPSEIVVDTPCRVGVGKKKNQKLIEQQVWTKLKQDQEYRDKLVEVELIKQENDRIRLEVEKERLAVKRDKLKMQQELENKKIKLDEERHNLYLMQAKEINMMCSELLSLVKENYRKP